MEGIETPNGAYPRRWDVLHVLKKGTHPDTSEKLLSYKQTKRCNRLSDKHAIWPNVN